MNPEHSVNFKDLWCSKGTQELREGLSQGNWAHLTAHLRPGPASGPALPPAPTPPTATAQAQCLRAVSRSGLTRASRGALGSGCAASDRLWRERMTPRGYLSRNESLIHCFLPVLRKQQREVAQQVSVCLRHGAQGWPPHMRSLRTEGAGTGLGGKSLVTSRGGGSSWLALGSSVGPTSPKETIGLTDQDCPGLNSKKTKWQNPSVDFIEVCCNSRVDFPPWRTSVVCT